MAKWYDDYLQSDQWHRKRLQRLLMGDINEDYRAIRCERKECGLYVPLLHVDTHHLTYKRVRHERMEDLQILCHSCHMVMHGYEPNLWWIEAKQSGKQFVFAPTINRERHLHRIGDVMFECLAYCDEKYSTQCLAEGAQTIL